MRKLTVLTLIAGMALAQGDKKKPGQGRMLVPRWEKGGRAKVLVTITRTSRVVTQIFDTTTRVITDCRYEQTAIEVKDGRPVRAKRKFTKYETKTITTTKGRRSASSEMNKHTLAGRTIELVREKGVLKPVTEPPQVDTNELMTAGPDWLWLLPEGPVKVKDTWTIQSGWHFLVIHAVFVGNNTTCKLEKLSNGVASIRFTAGPRCNGLAKFSRTHGRFTHVEYEFETKEFDVSMQTKVTFDQKRLPAKKKKS
ncbi:MAG: hypothetical protein V3T86_10915 [Planctomycetota bacterium]